MALYEVDVLNIGGHFERANTNKSSLDPKSKAFLDGVQGKINELKNFEKGKANKSFLTDSPIRIVVGSNANRELFKKVTSLLKEGKHVILPRNLILHGANIVPLSVLKDFKEAVKNNKNLHIVNRSPEARAKAEEIFYQKTPA